MSKKSDNGGEAIGAIIGLAFAAAMVILAVLTLASIGSIFGAGVAIQNYFLAFRSNVQTERATP